MNQYDSRFDLKIIVGHCDLYFMVQWFYLEEYLMYEHHFRDYESVWPGIDLKIYVAIFHGPLIFALYLEDYLIYEHHTLGLWVSMIGRLT